MSRKIKPSQTIGQQAQHPRSDRNLARKRKRNSPKKNSQLLALKKKNKSSDRNRSSVISINKSDRTQVKKRESSSSLPKNRRRKNARAPMLLAVYLITIAIGISTILGTIVAIPNSFASITEETASSNVAQVQAIDNKQQHLEGLFSISALGTEIPDLKAKITNLTAKYPELEPEIFIYDLDTKGYVGINHTTEISSASTIKLPILIAFFQAVDAEKIYLDEKLTMTEESIGDGSGNMRYEKPGTQFSALETASKMMTISDNTATNMLIERLGGMDVLNQKFAAWGLNATRLRNPLPDLEGTNTTSPEDLSNLLARIDRGELISARSRDRALHIMRNIVRNTLLPEGLDEDALIAHKTGDIKSVLGDVGIIDMPTGKRYIAAILVKRPDNSPEAKELIQKISKLTYQHFKWQQPRSFTLDKDRREN